MYKMESYCLQSKRHIENTDPEVSSTSNGRVIMLSKCAICSSKNPDLKRRTFADKVLRDKAFNIAKNSKYDGYQTGLASMVYKFFDKKSTGSGIAK